MTQLKKININLSEHIPYDLSIQNDNTLNLTKGIISGLVPLDSIILDLVKFLQLESKNISFFSTKEGSVFVSITSNFELIEEEILNIIIEIISNELPNTLKNRDTKTPLIYITEDLIGFPLIGSMYFGVIDRGTSLLQVRSITGCPLNCPFCSVDEGPASKSKLRDFIVDPDYLVTTYSNVIAQKSISNVEAHLDGQGEPMSYPYLTSLIEKLNTVPETKIISIQTNGWYLTEKLIDELSEVGLDRINLSINSMKFSKAKRLAGRGDYPLERILQMAEYIIDSNIDLLLAPLWIPSINDEDILEIIKFSKKYNTKQSSFPKLGIQNYLSHSEGRNIKKVKPKRFSEFYKELRELEKKLQVEDLVLKQSMFQTKKSKIIDNPLSIDEQVRAKIILPGRVENEAFAIAKKRIIHVINASSTTIGKTVELKITRNKHNIFFGKII